MMKSILQGQTIKRELFIFYLVLITTFICITGIFIGYDMVKSTRDEIFNNSIELAHSVGNTINMYIDEVNHLTQTMSEILKSTHTSEKPQESDITDILTTFLDNHLDIEKIKYINAEGNVINIVPFSKSEIGNNLLQAPYIKNIAEDVFWSDVFLSAVTGDPSVTISKKSGDVYVVIDISLSQLSFVLSKIQRNSEIILYDSKGRAVASTNIEEVHHGVNHSNMEHVKSALNGNVVTNNFVYRGKDGELDMLGTAMPLNNNWVIVVARELSEVYSPLYSALFTIFFAGILAFVTGYFVFHIISRRLKGAIDSFIVWSKHLADGNYNVDVKMDSYAELNQLANSLNKMSDEIEFREMELNNQKLELNASNEELESYNEEMAAINEALMDSEKRANESNRAKSEFLANMSHELRTPLNGIMGFSQILKATELTNEQSEYIDNVLYSSKHLLQIINDILDFSKIEAGKLDLEKTETDLKELLENSFTLIKPSADKKGLNAILKIDKKIPRFVMTDPLRLSQIIINLLSNAVKFTETGEIGLEVYVLMADRKKTRIRFVVFDSGIGIPKQKQLTIFDMFTQVDSSFTRKYGGTGLGLAISNRILSHMDSEMIIESEVNKGSVFSFELTFDNVVQNKELEPVNAEKENTLMCDRDIKVLIVEDDFINSKLAKTIIQKNIPHSTVVQAYNGEEGVEKFFESHPDLVFMDLHMPIKNGIDAVKEIRANEKDDEHAKIVFLSADIRNDKINEALESGFDSYIRKPFSKKEFFDCLQKICNEDK